MAKAKVTPKKKKIRSSSAKAKGRRLQQWVCMKIGELLRMDWGKDCMIASREMGQSGTDVRLIGLALRRFPWSVECKWQETWSVTAWTKQAEKNRLPGTNWILFCKKNNQEAVAILNAETFFELVEKAQRNEKQPHSARKRTT